MNLFTAEELAEITAQDSTFADSFQTPPPPILTLLCYIPKQWVVWEPHCEEGQMVQTICRARYDVFGTDIMQGYDFL